MSEAIAKHQQISRDSIEGVVIAQLIGFRQDRALVQIPGDAALLLVSQACGPRLNEDDVGASVALTFISGDPKQPLIIGKIVCPARFTTATVHQRELSFEADQSIIFRCGKSSVTLRRDGQIEIRGEHVLSEAASVNRVRGGMVKLN